LLDEVNRQPSHWQQMFRRVSSSSQPMIWAIKYEDGKVAATGLLVDSRDPSRNGGPKSIQPSSFGEDADGELYMVDNTLGWCYRIVPGN
jgi:hypothetical protein